MEHKMKLEGPPDQVFAVRAWLDFGERVRDLRKARGWTQTDLAQRLKASHIDMHQTTVAKLEGGTRPTAVHEVLALARVFRVQYGDLLPPLQPVSEGEAEMQRLMIEVHNAAARVSELYAQLEEARAHSVRVGTRLAELQDQLGRQRGESDG